MSKPSSAQLAANMQPLVRDFVEAKVDEELRKAVADLSAKIESISAKKEIADLGDRLGAAESSMRVDDKYSLTRAKLIRLMREMGIE